MFDISQTLVLPFEKTEFDPAKNFVELLRFPVFMPNKVGYKLFPAKWIETRNPSQLLRNEKKTSLGTLCTHQWWCLGVAESMGTYTQMCQCDWNLIENYYTRNTWMPQSRNYAPVQSVNLYCDMIFTIEIFFHSFLLLATKSAHCNWILSSS